MSYIQRFSGFGVIYEAFSKSNSLSRDSNEKFINMLNSQHNYGLAEDRKTNRLYDLELFKMFLRAHFLFNSLNNLYALSLKQSDKTSDAIAGLSVLLEKVVYYSSLEKISLSKEVMLIKDYIYLEKIWLGEATFIIDLNVSGDLDSIEIPPLVLYTFVENCFKHGIRKCTKQAWVNINIDATNGKLSFSARNSVPMCDNEISLLNTNHKGMGVAAAREVLDHKYHGKHYLKIDSTNKVHQVDLMIDPD